MANFLNRRQFTIEWSHCDPAGIVFNSRFFEYFDWGTWSLFEAALACGRLSSPPHLVSISPPLVDASARFIAPARFGDRVELASQVIVFRCSSFDVGHQLFVSGTVAVEGQETRVGAGAIRPIHPG